MLLQFLETWVPYLWENNQPLINISTGKKANTDFIEKFKTRYDQGAVGMNKFFKCITKKRRRKNYSLEIFLRSN